MGKMFVWALMQNNSISLQAKVATHFSANCYPAIPSIMIPIALEAIARAKSNLFDYSLTLPYGIKFRNQTFILVKDAIIFLHLEDMINYNAFENE